MTVYPKSAYKNPWPNGVPNSSASSRGWGPGWPNCQASKMVTIVAQDQTTGENYDIRVTVRREIAQMVVDLLEATDALYDVDQHDTGAYNCRPIGGTSTASNHSWGLAIDINWENNPQGTFHSEIPPAVVAMWIDCGFGWGGFYGRALPDTMHFEYLGTPASVAANAKKAAVYASGNVPVPAPKPKPKPTPQTYVVTLGKNVAPGKTDKTTLDLQRALIAAGFAKGIFTEPNKTGKYGKGTEQAVRAFFDKYPAYQSSAKDVAIGAHGWTFLRALAIKSGE